MLTCNCTLPYTNPDACKNCSVRLNHENQELMNGLSNDFDTYKYDYQKPKTIKKTTRTIERYDSEEKLISKEIITEEEEIDTAWDMNNPNDGPFWTVNSDNTITFKDGTTTLNSLSKDPDAKS